MKYLKALKDIYFIHLRNFVNDRFKDKSEEEKERLFQLFRYKGIYPYDYPKSYDTFNETKLPSKKQFYTCLRKEHITYKEYYRAKIIWRKTECKTFGDYSNLYNELDVIL